MKTRVWFIITLLMLTLMASSCGHKEMFTLSGTVSGDTDTLIVTGIDSRFDRIDTILCDHGEFEWSFKPDTVTTLLLILPDGRRHPVFAEKNLRSAIAIPSDTGLFRVTGGYFNGSYQSFYEQTQNDTTIEQVIERIERFIIADPFSEVTPYIIYEQLIQKYHAQEEQIEKLIKGVSGNMQDSPFFNMIKPELKGPLTENIYLNSWYVRDSLNNRYQFSSIGSNQNHVLTYIWSTWSGDESFRIRRELDSLKNKYAERKLLVADVSVDVNVDRWKEAITGDTLEWLSYIDSQGMESRAVKNASITHFPVFLLLSGSKRLVFRSYSFQETDSLLNLYLPPLQEKNTHKKKK